MPTDQAEPLTFDDAAIERLRLAAEEVAWLTGRGYALDVASELVANHHQLSPAHRMALACGTCSEPQYRRRAARELEAEDVARRPLSIDAIDALLAVEAALSGRPVLQTLDGSVRAFGIERATYAPSAVTDEAIDRLMLSAKELRPSLLRFFVDEAATGASSLANRLGDRAKIHKLKTEIAMVGDVIAALRKERQIVTGEAVALDACGGWYGLVGRVMDSIAGTKIVRLQ